MVVTRFFIQKLKGIKFGRNFPKKFKLKEQYRVKLSSKKKFRLIKRFRKRLNKYHRSKVVRELTTYGLYKYYKKLYSEYSGVNKRQKYYFFCLPKKLYVDSFKFAKQNRLIFEEQLYNYNKNRIFELVRLKTYRGTRHKSSRPVRGQRTKTNAHTQRRLIRFEKLQDLKYKDIKKKIYGKK